MRHSCDGCGITWHADIISKVNAANCEGDENTQIMESGEAANVLYCLSFIQGLLEYFPLIRIFFVGTKFPSLFRKKNGIDVRNI